MIHAATWEGESFRHSILTFCIKDQGLLDKDWPLSFSPSHCLPPHPSPSSFSNTEPARGQRLGQSLDLERSCPPAVYVLLAKWTPHSWREWTWEVSDRLSNAIAWVHTLCSCCNKCDSLFWTEHCEYGWLWMQPVDLISHLCRSQGVRELYAIWLQTCTILQGKGRLSPTEIQRPADLPAQFLRGGPCLRLNKRDNLQPEVSGVGSPCEALGPGLPRACEMEPKPWKWDLYLTAMDAKLLPQWTQKVGYQTIMTALQCNSDRIALLGFGLAWGVSPLSSFLSLPFGTSSLSCPTTVFWKNITCLIAQVYCQGGILPRDELSQVSLLPDLDDIWLWLL